MMTKDSFPEGESDNLVAGFGPNAVDTIVREAIKMCWLMAPKGKRNTSFVDSEMRRLLERALRDLAEDSEHFTSGS